LAAAIAIDATVVRCLLVPAVMTLLGKAAWWMPDWLARVTPRISIEGQNYFARLDAKSTEAAPVAASPEPEPEPVAR
jgi:RND superfamily putative drug exporter